MTLHQNKARISVIQKGNGLNPDYVRGWCAVFTLSQIVTTFISSFIKFKSERRRLARRNCTTDGVPEMHKYHRFHDLVRELRRDYDCVQTSLYSGYIISATVETSHQGADFTPKALHFPGTSMSFMTEFWNLAWNWHSTFENYKSLRINTFDKG